MILGQFNLSVKPSRFIMIARGMKEFPMLFIRSSETIMIFLKVAK